ncbi:MAG: hypothetical protein IKW50_03570, partial [Oscillospiraceae bacterium]|nr:hypothetical protein [Oscillospiraceae bacterium]
IAEFMQMRNILTPLCGYTSSAPVGHLLLKEKACGCGAKLKDKLQFTPFPCKKTGRSLSGMPRVFI